MIHELMSGCPWAQNKAKLERAIKEVRGDNAETGETGKNEVTERAVLVVYRRLLGFVVEDQVPKVKAEETEEAPKKPGRPASK